MLKIIYGEAAILIISYHVFAKEECRNAQVLLTEYSIHTSKPLRLAFCLGKSLKVILFYACFLSILYLVKGCYGVAEALFVKRKPFSCNFNKRVARILVIDSERFCSPTFYLNGHTL